MTDDDAQRKAFVTLQAKAALCGCELLAMAGGTFVLSRWDRMREFGSLADVAALLAQMGAPSGTSSRD